MVAYEGMAQKLNEVGSARLYAGVAAHRLVPSRLADLGIEPRYGDGAA